MSLGVNFLASSTAWVGSALWGSQADESFCWALLSLPASGPATANTAIQNARTNHFVHRPHGRAAIRRAQLTLPARFGASSPPAAVRLAAFRKLPEIPMVRSPIVVGRHAFQAVPRCVRERLGTARWCCICIGSSVGGAITGLSLLVPCARCPRGCRPAGVQRA